MIYTFKGRYATKAKSTITKGNALSILQDFAMVRPQDSSAQERTTIQYKQATYLFFGDLKDKRRKLEDINNRSAICLNIRCVNFKLTTVADVYDRLKNLWGFDFFLYPDFDNYIKGLKLIAIIPLKEPLTSAKAYDAAQNFFIHSLYKQQVIWKTGYLQPNWTSAISAPFLSKPETDTNHEIYFHDRKAKIDVSSSEFQEQAHIDLATDVTVKDMLNREVQFNPDEITVHDLIDKFTTSHQDWLADKINFLACCLALKRAENRGEIDHDEALDAVITLGGVNADWIEHNPEFYEAIKTEDVVLSKGPSMSFFITKATTNHDVDWITLNEHGTPIIDYAMIGNRILEQTHYMVNDEMHYGREAIYTNGRWIITNARNVLNALVSQIITDAYPLISWRANIQHEIVSYVVSTSAAKFHNDVAKDPFAHPAPYLIQFKNGTLNLATGEFSKNKAENYLLHTIPYNYDPDKAINNDLLAVKWLTYLMNNDKIAALHFCAFLGMAFTQAYDKQEFLMLIGSGSNGKTTLLNYIKSLFEANDAVDISLTEIADSRNRFAASQLYLSHLALTSETNSNTYIKSTDVLKKLTGNESLKMERKGLDPFVGPAYAGIICAANELPTITDRTKGIRRRMVAIAMDRDFEDKETRKESQQEFPMKKLNDERADFIKFCLFLFKSSVLDKNSATDYFKFSDKMKENTTSWAEQGDSIKDFADTWCVKTDDLTLGEDFKDLYQLYEYDTRAGGATPMNRNNFTRNLMDFFHLPRENKKRLRLDKHQATRILQVCFNEDALSLIWDDLTKKSPDAFHLTGYAHRGAYTLAGEKLLARKQPK